METKRYGNSSGWTRAFSLLRSETGPPKLLVLSWESALLLFQSQSVLSHCRHALK